MWFRLRREPTGDEICEAVLKLTRSIVDESRRDPGGCFHPDYERVVGHPEKPGSRGLRSAAPTAHHGPMHRREHAA